MITIIVVTSQYQLYNIARYYYILEELKDRDLRTKMSAKIFPNDLYYLCDAATTACDIEATFFIPRYGRDAIPLDTIFL